MSVSQEASAYCILGCVQPAGAPLRPCHPALSLYSRSLRTRGEVLPTDMSTRARRGLGPAPGSPAGSAPASGIHSGFHLVPRPHRGSLLGPRAAERKEQTARLLARNEVLTAQPPNARWDGKTPPLLRAGEGDAAAHLWGVLLELSALLDEPLSRLLAFILPVRQYCCGGIEFPLRRETRREGEIVIALCTGGEHICT